MAISQNTIEMNGYYELSDCGSTILTGYLAGVIIKGYHK